MYNPFRMQSNEIVYTPFNNQVLVSENHALLSSTYTVPTYDINFKVMHTPLLPPLGFHYTCQVMHKVLICYNFFCFLHFQISGIDHSNVMFHLGSGGGLLITCFFYPLGTVNYMQPASSGF